MIKRIQRLALVLTAVIGGSAALSTTARAQDAVPASAKPPAGMCRIWVDGVPASQQPAPTDCATAVRNKPANGRVIWGDSAGAASRKELPFLKDFSEKGRERKVDSTQKPDGRRPDAHKPGKPRKPDDR